MFKTSGVLVCALCGGQVPYSTTVHFNFNYQHTTRCLPWGQLSL